MHPSFKLATLTLAVNAALLTSVAAQAAVEPLPSVTLPTITVTAETETADGPVQGIAANTVSSTTGTDESILKSTQSVTVVGQQEIETINATNIMNALDYSTGVNITEAGDRLTESSMIRGFQNQGAYRDGQKYQAEVYNGQQEVYGLERIEVVKGPASVLSGTLPPGGVINAISKKPLFTNTSEVNAEVGSFNRKQVSTDLNHKVNDELAVRLVGLYRNSDTFVDFVPDDRTYIAPSLTWRPSEDTTLTLQADYQHDLAKYVGGFSPRGVLDLTNNEKIPQNRYHGTPSFDKYENKRYTVGYEIDHNLTPEVKINHYIRYMQADLDFPWTYSSDLGEADNYLAKRNLYDEVNLSKQLTGGVSGVYDWRIGDSIDNTSLLGFDYARQYHDTEIYSGSANAIDLMNPNYANDSIGPLKAATNYSEKSRRNQKGIFLQNQATINDKWVGLLGVRHDKASLEQEAFFDPSNRQEGDYSATTGRAGLVYLMDNGIAPYASINQSFEVNLGKDRNGDLFEPTKGTQYEVGMRYQPEGSDTLLTGSLYRIDQTNVTVPDPVDKNFQTQIGEVRAQGIELEAKTQVGDNANLIAAYAYTDARTTKASPLYPEDEGKRTGNVPYNKFSLWGDYRFSEFGLPQLKVGTGVRYTDSAAVDYRDFSSPSYTLVDAMASYEVNNNWLLSLNVKNLLDKEYIVCSYDCFYGEPRNVVGKITYKW